MGGIVILGLMAVLAVFAALADRLRGRQPDRFRRTRAGRSTRSASPDAAASGRVLDAGLADRGQRPTVDLAPSIRRPGELNSARSATSRRSSAGAGQAVDDADRPRRGAQDRRRLRSRSGRPSTSRRC